jgi:protease I
MKSLLDGKCVAILVADGFEQSELEGPYDALFEAGATVDIVSPNQDTVKAWAEKNYGATFKVDTPLNEADPDDYDALVLPGGVMSPDYLRTVPEAVQFVRIVFEAGKPIAAICHGPQILIEAGVVAGRLMTSTRSLKTDLLNAGAEWIDLPVVNDRGLVTSRKPEDIPQFNVKMLEEIAEGIHARRERKG